MLLMLQKSYCCKFSSISETNYLTFRHLWIRHILVILQTSLYTWQTYIIYILKGRVLTISFSWSFLVFFWPYIMFICVLKGFYTRKSQFPCNYWNPQFLLLLLLPSSSFARGRPLRMIICKRPVPQDHHLQEAGPSGWPFARGRSLRIIICKRPVPLDHRLQEAGPSFWQPQKWHEKCIFETLLNEIKCVLSVK